MSAPSRVDVAGVRDLLPHPTFYSPRRVIPIRDFDADRAERHKEREQALGDRTFKLGGEVFAYNVNVSVDVLRQMSGEAEVLMGAAYINAIQAACLDFIEDDGDAHERFAALLKRRKDPITMEDLQAVFTGLVEEAFKRPTEAFSHSLGGDAKTGTPSTATSSTAPAVASAA